MRHSDSAEFRGRRDPAQWIEEGVRGWKMEGGTGVVFDTDFGGGGFFWGVVRAWMEREGPRGRRLCYAGVIGREAFEGVLGVLDQELGRGLARSASGWGGWHPAVRGTHRWALFGGQVLLHLVCGEIEWVLDRWKSPVDAWLVRNSNAAGLGRGDAARLAWIGKIARCSADGAGVWVERATLEERSLLQKAGFDLASRSALEGEECGSVVGSLRPFERRHPRPQSAGGPRDRSAIVVGAGLAGTAVAAALVRRGWRVQLVERGQAVASGASGNLGAVFSPMVSRDDGRAARLSRHCFLELRRELEVFREEGHSVHWSGSGVLQLARNAREAAVFEALVSEQAFPADFAQWLGAGEAARVVGRAVPVGGLWFAHAGWVNPPSLCEARLRAAVLANPGGTLTFFTGSPVSEIRWHESSEEWGGWTEEGRELDRAERLILANGFDAASLGLGLILPQKKVRGQVSHLPSSAFEGMRGVLTGEGYLIPEAMGCSLLGASYDFGCENFGLLLESHLGNLSRLKGLLAEVPGSIREFPWEGRVGFRSLTPDRFPLVGAVHRWGDRGQPEAIPGLFAMVGLGSRGVVWSGALGELLASQLEGEPCPLEGDLAEAVNPARFLRRQA